MDAISWNRHFRGRKLCCTERRRAMKNWLALAAIVVIVLGAGITWIVIANRSIDRRLAAVRVNPDPGLDQPGKVVTSGMAGAENSKPTEPVPAAEEPRPSASAAMSP